MSILRNLVNVDIFTDAYRVSGRVGVGVGGIHGDLNSTNSDFLDLEEAYISRIQEPGDIVANYTEASFRKENINFIVMQNRKDGIPIGTQHGRSVYVRGRPFPILITVPSFEIRGEVYSDTHPTPGAILTLSVGKFQPIFVAMASASLFPDISYSGDLILVHKDRIGIFCLGGPRK